MLKIESAFYVGLFLALAFGCGGEDPLAYLDGSGCVESKSYYGPAAVSPSNFLADTIWVCPVATYRVVCNSDGTTELCSCFYTKDGKQVTSGGSKTGTGKAPQDKYELALYAKSFCAPWDPPFLSDGHN